MDQLICLEGGGKALGNGIIHMTYTNLLSLLFSVIPSWESELRESELRDTPSQKICHIHDLFIKY